MYIQWDNNNKIVCDRSKQVACKGEQIIISVIVTNVLIKLFTFMSDVMNNLMFD